MRRSCISDIQYLRRRFEARCIEAGHRGVQFRSGTAGDDDMCAFVRQCFGGSGADASTAARNQGNLRLQGQGEIQFELLMLISRLKI